MTISVGLVSIGSTNDTSNNYFVSTTAGSSSGSGSSFYAIVTQQQPTVNLGMNVTDSTGVNSYSQIGSAINDLQSQTLLRYLTTNGSGSASFVAKATTPTYATGMISSVSGTSSITDTSKSWTTNQWANYNCFDVTKTQSATVGSNNNNTLSFSAIPSGAVAGDSYIVGAFKGTIVLIEIRGGKPTSLVDVSATNSGYLDTTQSATWPSVTLGSEAANGALIVSTFMLRDFATISYTPPTGYTLAYSYGQGTSYPSSICMAVAYQTVSGAGTYQPIWSIGGGTVYMATSVDVFLGAAGGGGGHAPQLMTLGCC